MKNTSTTKKILISLIGLNICVASLYAAAYIRINKNNGTLSALADVAEEDSQKDQTLRAIKSSLAENKDFIGEINSFFIAPEGVVEFINSLEAFGRSAGIDLAIGSVEVPPSSATAADFKEPLHLRFEIEGTWQNVHYFLSILENLPYVITLNQVSFTLNSAADSILFKGEAKPRAKGPDEKWKGSVDVTVLKLKNS